MSKVSVFSHYVELTSDDAFFVRVGDDDWDNHIMVSKTHKNALCGFSVNKVGESSKLTTRELYADMLCPKCIGRIYKAIARVNKA